MDTAILLIVTNLLSIIGIKNISRSGGVTDVHIPCLLNPPHEVILFWKINDTIYYHMDIPSPYMVHHRSIEIPFVDSSLNGTSFQCFIPSSSGDSLMSSTIGVLTVREKGHFRVSSYQKAKLALDHQRFLFTPDFFILAWKILKTDARIHIYNLTVESSCTLNSNNNIFITNESIVSLSPEELLDDTNTSARLNLTSIDVENSTFLTLEMFRIEPGIITEDVHVCRINQSESIISVPTCFSVPSVNGRQTLVLAIPFQLSNNVMQDLLCPIQPISGERCVNLLSCNRFRESAYANSITICRATNDHDDLNLEMCFHNITETMNGTKVHIFYSSLLQQCGIQELTRTYIKSIRLLIMDSMSVDTPITINRTIYSTASVCFESSSSCFQDDKTMFTITVKDAIGCTLYQSNNTIDNSCIPFNMIPMNMACASSYHLEVEVYGILMHRRPIMEIPGFSEAVTVQSSKCPCNNDSTTATVAVSIVHQTESTQVLAVGLCVIIAFIIVILLIVIAIVTCRNFKQ